MKMTLLLYESGLVATWAHVAHMPTDLAGGLDSVLQYGAYRRWWGRFNANGIS